MVPDKNYAVEIVFADGRTLSAQTSELIPKTPGGMKWLELSFISPRNGPATVKLVPAKIGQDRLLFGTDAVVHNFAWELGRLLSLDLPEAMIRPALGANLSGLLARRADNWSVDNK